ncbi:hypothetical protein [Calothrix sp. NIES-2098]|uniref:hypothetical protein n=1 Tax=Calothrix sp. NIES-2098 TaxID=1954171 RepID=UPI000B5F6C86|nr:putative methyltransferase [Calothrix sp. NIES-2098]
MTYESVTAFASPPNETWIRKQLISAIKSQPTRILDLGCGTGAEQYRLLYVAMTRVKRFL